MLPVETSLLYSEPVAASSGLAMPDDAKGRGGAAAAAGRAALLLLVVADLFCVGYDGGRPPDVEVAVVVEPFSVSVVERGRAGDEAAVEGVGWAVLLLLFWAAAAVFVFSFFDFLPKNGKRGMVSCRVSQREGAMDGQVAV